jgi:2-keto-4-pentenoate hydratase
MAEVWSLAEVAYLDAYLAAERFVETFDPLTAFTRRASLDRAYVLQSSLTAGRVSAGLRGGLMSLRSQEAKGVTAPVLGVQLVDRHHIGPARLSLSRYRRPALELKLAFRLSRAITFPLSPENAMISYVESVVPIIDIPDIAYTDPDRYSAIDMVAANVSSADWVAGSPMNPAGFDLNAVAISLKVNGQHATCGHARDSMGDQWASLRLLVNLALAQGRLIAGGDIVLTGKLGEKVEVVPGHYRADFASLGVVEAVIDP